MTTSGVGRYHIINNAHGIGLTWSEASYLRENRRAQVEHGGAVHTGNEAMVQHCGADPGR